MGTRVLIVAAAAAFVLVVLSCERTSSKYCELPEHADDPHCKMIDAAIDAPPPCTTNAMCKAPDPVCDTTSGTCVQCLGSGDCSGSNALCNMATHTCVGCVTHGDCPSKLCQDDGTCADASTIIYIDGGSGTDTGTCMQGAPCKTFTYALGASASPGGRTLVKVTNTVTDNVALGSTPWTIYADPGITKLVPAATNAVTLALTGANPTIYDLEIDGQAMQSAITSIANMPSTLRLYRCTVQGAGTGKLGIDYKGGALNVFQSTITNNLGGGIATDATAAFVIENTFIVRNGNGGAGGGIDIGAAGAANNVFMFNTVVDNNGKGDNAQHVAGVGCPAGNTLAAPNNLLARNLAAGVPDNTLTLTNTGACDFTSSLVQNDDTGLSFVNDTGSGSANYHLQAGSIAIDKAPDGAPNIDIDVDGQHRPYGSAKDYGADEYVP